MTPELRSKIEEWRSHLLDTSKRNKLISLKIGKTGSIGFVHPDTERIWDLLLSEETSMRFPTKCYLVGIEPEDDENEDFTEITENIADKPDDLVLLTHQIDDRSKKNLQKEIEFDESDAKYISNDNKVGGFKQGSKGSSQEKPVYSKGLKSERITIEECLGSDNLEHNHILTDLTDKQLRTKLGRLAINAKSSLAEQGVPTLYLTFGLLKWFESPDSQIQIVSPLLLVPVELFREDVQSPWDIKIQDSEIIPNFSLIQLLASSFNIKIPEINTSQESDSAELKRDYFKEVKKAIKNQSKWELEDKCTLGIFSFQKMAMWDDIGKNASQIMGHDLCRAIAGDKSVELSTFNDLPKAEDLDRILDPINTYNILDSDSSQQEAIEAVKRGANLVLNGPPGTGKSQTIANIIAEFLAVGKTVLFVSEKSAALEVVKRRLDKKHLGDFCLECHSHKANKKGVIEELGRCLSLPPETYQDQTEDLNRLKGVKSTLNNYVQKLHMVQKPLSLSLFQVHGKLAGLDSVRTSLCIIQDVMNTDLESLTVDQNLIRSLIDFKNAILRNDDHPWRGLSQPINFFTTKHDTEFHLERIKQGLLNVKATSKKLVDLKILDSNFSIPEWIRTVDELSTIRTFPVVPAIWFETDPRQMAADYQLLDVSLSQRDHVRIQISSFSDVGIERLSQYDPIVFQEIANVYSKQKNPNGITVRKLCSKIKNSIDTLRQFKESVERLYTSLEKALRSIGIRPRSLGLKNALDLTHVFLKLDEVVPIKSSWLDPMKQKEIRKFLIKYKQDKELIANSRMQLFDKLLPKAFSPEVRNIVHQSQYYRSFLYRLMPRWWELKRKLSMLYPGTLPSTSKLLADMLQLSEYHGRLEVLNQIVEQYSDNLVFTKDGVLDYTKINTSLDACEVISSLIIEFPKFRDILIRENEIDFMEIKDVMNTLEENYKRYHDIESELHSHIDISNTIFNKSIVTLAEVISSLDKEIVNSQNRFLSVEALTQQLKNDHDCEINKIGESILKARKILNADHVIDSVSNKLGFSSKDNHIIKKNVKEGLIIADWLTRFLDFYKDSPPIHLVRVLTDNSLREEVVDSTKYNLISKTPELMESWNFLINLFEPDTEVSTGIVLNHAKLDVLIEWVNSRLSDLDLIGEWAKYVEIKKSISEKGLDKILYEIKNNYFEIENAHHAYLKRFYLTWLGYIYPKDPVISGFDGTNHQQVIEIFQDIDKSSVRKSHTRIRERLLSDPSRPNHSLMNAPNSSELGILMREIHKKRRHMPLRQLFSKTPNIILRLKPCMMMSPLAVSTYLNTQDIKFDLVIFDEASQVRPYDAITAIYRCKQLVVAGDQKQLPPTSFFERSLAEDELSSDEMIPDEKISDYESILDVCLTVGVTQKGLRWHYRSRREPLIAFSNMNFYNNELITFPSIEDTGTVPAVLFDFVENGVWKSGQNGGFNRHEANRIANLVMDHFRHNPKKSLGVIAFSQKQQHAIINELERLRRSDLSMEEFFDEDKEEPFFVKNLENVQGDERDYIFLGVGYGPDESGKVAMRFGPLNRQGGERRLNVAVTRARQSITVVASMRSHQIDPNRTSSNGVRLLRAYLDFAERGVEALGSQVTQISEADYDSDFEKCVAESLRAKGMEVRTQVGCSGYRIDLALVDPENPGRFVLGIECDGATYHNSATARDRDRLRQDVLESLGWKIIRIWSTDWIKTPSQQVERVINEYRKRLEYLKSNEINEVTSDITEFEDEKPIFVKEAVSLIATEEPAFYYGKIYDVPEEVIEGLILEALNRYGITEQNELIKSVSKKLGFQRTGINIQNRLTQCIERLVYNERISRKDDGRLTV